MSEENSCSEEFSACSPAPCWLSIRLMRSSRRPSASRIGSKALAGASATSVSMWFEPSRHQVERIAHGGSDALLRRGEALCLVGVAHLALFDPVGDRVERGVGPQLVAPHVASRLGHRRGNERLGVEILGEIGVMIELGIARIVMHARLAASGVAAHHGSNPSQFALPAS